MVRAAEANRARIDRIQRDCAEKVRLLQAENLKQKATWDLTMNKQSNEHSDYVLRIQTEYSANIEKLNQSYASLRN